MKHERVRQDSLRKKFLRSPLLIMTGCLLTLILCVSCEKAMPPETIEQGEAEKDVIVQAVESGSREKVINEAIAKFDEENGSGSHQEYDISVSETTEEWTVFFDGKTKSPGNHAIVVINKSIGEITYLPGE